MVLILHELSSDQHGEWHNIIDAVIVTLNLGLYGYFDDTVFSTKRRFLLAVYEIYMMVVQVIFLNLLIAVMSESHSRVSGQSELVALCGRAKLILEYELEEYGSEMKGRKKQQLLQQQLTEALIGTAQAVAEHVEELQTSKAAAAAAKEHRDLLRRQRVCPRWLHVLVPSNDRVAVAEEMQCNIKIEPVKVPATPAAPAASSPDLALNPIPRPAPPLQPSHITTHHPSHHRTRICSHVST